MNSSFVPCQTINRFPDQWLNVSFVQPAAGHVDMVDALLSQPTGAWLDYPPAIAVA